MALADAVLITGEYEIGPVTTTLLDIFTPETTDAWCRVLCRMGMENIRLRSSFEDEMKIVCKAYHLRMYGAKDFEPAVLPGWTVQNTMMFCFELLKLLLARLENVRDYARVSATFDHYIRVVGALTPLLPQKAMSFDISAPHAVLFVLESSADSFIYKKTWSSSVREGGFCKIHAIFMNILAKKLMQTSPPSLVTINNSQTAFGHFAGSNALVCTLVRLNREFVGSIMHEAFNDTRFTKHLVGLMGFCMNLSVENVKRLAEAGKASLGHMLADFSSSKETPNAYGGLTAVWKLFKHRIKEVECDTRGVPNRKRRMLHDGPGDGLCIAQPDFAQFEGAVKHPNKQRRVAV